MIDRMKTMAVELVSKSLKFQAETLSHGLALLNLSVGLNTGSACASTCVTTDAGDETPERSVNEEM